MGALILPTSGRVYVDAMTVIYSVERFPEYWPILEPMWQAAETKSIEIVSSDITLLEVMVGPLKKDDAELQQRFEQALLGTDVRLLPISHSVLREAARLRATVKLRTPDALHAATSQDAGCVLFVSNDFGFRSVPGLPLVLLDDVLKQ